MNFFKRLFSSSKNESDQSEKVNYNEIVTDKYFDERYSKHQLDPVIYDGAIKMIESYFHDNKINRTISEVNHPVNLDLAGNEGLGLLLYCKAFDMGDKETMLFLALAFSGYMMENFDFELYNDKTPEYPLRTMTLKYNKKGALLSLYPLEYSLKVLNHESNFEDLLTKIKTHLSNMPDVETLLKNLTDDKS